MNPMDPRGNKRNRAILRSSLRLPTLVHQRVCDHPQFSIIWVSERNSPSTTSSLANSSSRMSSSSSIKRSPARCHSVGGVISDGNSSALCYCYYVKWDPDTHKLIMEQLVETLSPKKRIKTLKHKHFWPPTRLLAIPTCLKELEQ